MRDKELAAWAKRVASAKDAAEIVGPDDEGRKDRVRQVRRDHHPDRFTNPLDRKLATEAFSRFEQLLAKNGTARSDEFTVSSKRFSFASTGLLHRGDIANIYGTTYKLGDDYVSGTMKIARSPRNNDLLVAEAKALKVLNEGNDKHKVFVPKLEDSFIFRDKATRVDRRTNVFREEWPGWVSLSDVFTSMIPFNLNPRDVAWMWRRALAGLDYIHSKGYVHGGVTPDHLLILPQDNGLMYVGFGSAVEIGQPIKIKPRLAVLAAPEMFDKQPATQATDIYMLSKSMLMLMGGGAPTPFKAFVEGCTYKRQAVRPQNAGSLLKELDALIERMWGPRTFRPFVLPAKL